MTDDAPLRVIEEQRTARSPPPVWIGSDPATIELRDLIAHVAKTDATVLIEGESGTGKDLVAKTIHALSPRAAHRLVAINCAAIPADLLESELFGHSKGAFTGAERTRQGLFQLADRGTLLLDEIGEMPLALQPKLLRVLEDQYVRPVGADRPIKVSVRVLASTNRSLSEQVERGQFRHDLYYRLQVVPLRIVPLRTRPQDIPELVQHFLADANRRYRQDRQPVTFSPEVWERLQRYDWPGNVRELQNTIARMVTLTMGDYCELDDLPSAIRWYLVSQRNVRLSPLADDEPLALDAVLRKVQTAYVDEAMRRAGGNKAEAAKLLGLKRTTLCAIMRRGRMRGGAKRQAKPRRATDTGTTPFGHWLLRARQQLGLTQWQLAHALSVSESTVFSWERQGREPLPQVRQAALRWFAQQGIAYDPTTELGGVT